MKKVIIYGIILCSIFFASCSAGAGAGKTPEATVEAIIRAEQNSNYNAWNKLWSKPDGFYKWQFKNFCEANKNNKYEILSAETTIDNDEATVYVNVTTEEGTEKHFAELSRRDEKWYVDYMNF